MNLLILSESLWPRGSGGELATYLYAKYLCKGGIDVKVLVKDIVHCPEWAGLDCYNLKGFGAGKYFWLSASSRTLVERLFRWSDVVYFTDLYDLIPLAKAMGKTTVAHLHSYFPSCPIGSHHTLRKNRECEPNGRECIKCIWNFEKAHLKSSKYAASSAFFNSITSDFFPFLLKNVDAIIFVSKAQRELFFKYFKTKVPSYVNYNPLPELSYLTIEGDGVGYFGGLSPLKGFDVLLQAWLNIHSRHQSSLFATKMGQLSKSGALTKAGISSYQILDNSMLDNIYRGIRCVVFPSVWNEPLPYVVSEALLRGRFLVASRVGGVPELLDGLSGFFMVEPNDANALSAALDNVLSMSRLDAIELGFKNRQEILRKFDNERITKGLIDILENIR